MKTYTPTGFFILTSLVIYFFSLSTSFASPSSEEEPERITVFRERTLPLVKRELRGQTKSFYRLYNQINDERKFTFICQTGKRPGSNIAQTSCEPRYIKQIRSDIIKRQGLTSTNFEFETKIAAKKERELAKAHMKEVILSNSELRKEFLRLNNLVLEWKQLKESKG